MKRRTDDGSGAADGAEDATMVYGIEGKPPKGFPRTGRTKPSNVQTELAVSSLRSAAVQFAVFMSLQVTRQRYAETWLMRSCSCPRKTLFWLCSSSRTLRSCQTGSRLAVPRQPCQTSGGHASRR